MSTPAADPHALAPGAQVGPYTVAELIGGGGMALVYKAHQPALDRYVALKVIRAELVRDPALRERFSREAHTIAHLEHPFILPLYDVGQADGVMYLAMRFVDSGTLGTLLAAGPLAPARACALVAQVADALGYAHRHGVIHRDVKPANILIAPDDHALLADFGIAKLLSELKHITDTGALIGTPYYMAPEQIQAGAVDARTDIYSLGLVLYECLTGRRPFEAETPWAVMQMQLSAPVPTPLDLVPTLPPALAQVVLRATAKHPAERFQTAEALAAALREIASASAQAGLATLPQHDLIAAQQSEAAPLSVAVRQPERLDLRRWRRWLLAGLVLLALGAGAIWYSAWPTAPPAAPVAQALAPSQLFTFADGQALGWAGAAPAWQVTRDERGGFVYEGQAPADSEVATAPPDAVQALLATTPNYAISVRFRIAVPSLVSDDLADFWLALRAQDDPAQHDGCESYSFFIDSATQSALIARAGNSSCGGFTPLASASIELVPSSWHTLQATVRDHQLALAIDNVPVAEADDDQLTAGTTYLSVGNGARIQFDDFQVSPLP